MINSNNDNNNYTLVSHTRYRIWCLAPNSHKHVCGCVWLCVYVCVCVRARVSVVCVCVCLLKCCARQLERVQFSLVQLTNLLVLFRLVSQFTKVLKLNNITYTRRPRRSRMKRRGRWSSSSSGLPLGIATRAPWSVTFFFKKNFCYEVIAKQKKKNCSANNYLYIRMYIYTRMYIYIQQILQIAKYDILVSKLIQQAAVEDYWQILYTKYQLLKHCACSRRRS